MGMLKIDSSCNNNFEENILLVLSVKASWLSCSRFKINIGYHHAKKLR